METWLVYGLNRPRALTFIARCPAGSPQEALSSIATQSGLYVVFAERDRHRFRVRSELVVEELSREEDA